MRNRLAGLAPLFRYPGEGYDPWSCPPFAHAIAELNLPQLQQTYTQTFDLAPSCSPYLGTHLFSEDSRDRARLMVGLRGAGVKGDELPDHIAEVLAFAPKFKEEEWRDLVTLVLAPALKKMDALLRDTANPYRHLIAATAALCGGGTSC